MAPPERPSARVLAALGLTGLLGTGVNCSDSDAGPCLSVAVDPNSEEGHLGPCLEMVEPPPEDVGPCLDVPMEEPPPDDPPVEDPTSQDPDPQPPREKPVHVGPCLKFAYEPPSEGAPPRTKDKGKKATDEQGLEPAEDPPPADKGEDQGALDRPVDRVLARGVLPSDVAELLRKRKS